MSTKLRQLALSCFRGATQAVKIDFDPDKKITMIFGENGTGKSSIVDAFSFLCEQSFGSLEDRSGADKKHIASILGRPDDLRVVLTTTTGTWKASYTGTNVKVEPTGGLPDVKILRRSQILRFIETQPRQRFEALKDYLTVPGVDRSEQSLRDAVRDVNEELNRLTQAYSQAQIALENLWNAEGKPSISAETWAKEEKGKDLTKLQQECEEIDSILQAFRDAERARSSWQNARTRFSSAETAYQKALAEQKVEEQKAVGQTGLLLNLLSKAIDYLRATKGVRSCPVCQQQVQADSLENELQAR
ncbi:MAG: ATP-binding protein, partial [Acidobacteria bacterium]|nr:ATP-binding protein [Acidobacteriota bacterium]